MKLKLENFVRTNLGFPSEWKGKSEEGNDIVLSFRQGRLKVFSNGDQVPLAHDYKDEWDITGYLEDSDLELILKKNDLIAV